MDERDVLQRLRDYYGGLFPLECPNCHRRFLTHRDYVVANSVIGPVVSYDANSEDWDTDEPVGTLVLTNCSCGNTLALDTSSLPHPEHLRLLQWVRDEAGRRAVTPQALMEHLRAEVRKALLASERGDG